MSAPASVTAKLRQLTVADPLGRSPHDDPWRDFRELELIDLKLDFTFKHSLGKVSRFFLELEHHRLMATRCPRCATVWMPPRAACGNDLSVTEWVEVPGRGTLAAAVECAYTLTTGGGGDRLVLAYVALERTSTLLLHQVRSYGDVGRLRAGLPMKVAWAEGKVRHPMELFWFEPAD
ncbi:MAG TPA: zinc ribbon domain-containing protein [Methylomirabilota bacterium]|jgi:uncharacterized OB-fold protein|nr:zinc ribbon domain-containing protein [Methylomirabilota bacterium]